jgi:hypothetical protein
MPNDPNKLRSLAPLLLFFGGFFVLLAVQEGCYQKGVKLRGVVVAKEYSPGTSRVGSGMVSSSSSHKIRYRFTTPEGEIREDRSDVLLANWSKLREGDPVNIEYLPATKDSRIAAQTASAPVFLLIALGLLTGGFYLRRSARVP